MYFNRPYLRPLPFANALLQEDINAQFGEKVAIHYFGATAEEQAEMDKAVQQDEEEEELRRHGGTTVTEKGTTEHTEVTPAKA